MISYQWSADSSNNILHRFLDITTCTVYMTVCGLKCLLVSIKTVEITGHVWSPIHLHRVPKLCELEKFQRAKVIFKVTKKIKANSTIPHEEC